MVNDEDVCRLQGRLLGKVAELIGVRAMRRVNREMRLAGIAY